MKYCKLFILCLSVVLLMLGIAACSEAEEPEIVIVHTNDTHSQIDAATIDGQLVGGVVQRAAMLEKMRQEDPDLLYLDAGDMIQGSPYFNIWNGVLEMEAMNLQSLIASTFGNHEFDNGIGFLCNMLDFADFPILSCNYDVNGTGLEKYVKKSMVMQCKDVNIGITGVTVDPKNLIFDKNWKGITFIDPVSAVNEEAQNLRDKGCDLVIVLSHLGYYKNDEEGDRWLAKHTRNVDLIIGGHSHTNLENGEEATNLDGKPVMITQTGGKINPMGCIRIKFKKAHTGKPGNHYEIKNITCSKLHPDSLDLSSYGQEMREFIQPYQDSLNAKMSDVLGTCAKDLPRYRPQSPLSNFASDALRVIGEQIYGQPMDIGLMNIGGLRNDLYAGDIKLGDIYKIFPFENAVCVLELKGKEVEAMVHQMEKKRLEGLSGTQITLEQNEEGKTLATNILIGGKRIDPNKTYRICTIDYLAEGNDGLVALTHAEHILNTGILLRDAMIDYMKALTAKGLQVDGNLDDRVIVKE